MSRGFSEDPVHPKVTFDNYVIPETVKSAPAGAFGRVGGPHVRPKASPDGRTALLMDPTIFSAGVIALLTFVLGIMVTLRLTGAEEEQRAVIAEPAQEVVAIAEPLPTPLRTEVTRQQTPDLLTPTLKEQEPAPAAIAPELQRAVIKGLQPKRTVGKFTEQELAVRAREAQAIVSRNKLRMLREGVMAGVYTVTARTDGDVTRLVLETVNAEMSRRSMGNLLLEAARKGDIEIPSSLSTANGEIDMDTMLFNLIQNSLANDGTLEGTEAALEMSRRAFAASDAKTNDVQGVRIYTVKPGDSLAYISLQFYGRPGAYLQIFEANRKLLNSPDEIQVGQRLIIPG